MGKYELALDDYNRAIKLDESNIYSIAGRGETYRLIGKFEQALADLDRAITINNEFEWVIGIQKPLPYYSKPSSVTPLTVSMPKRMTYMIPFGAYWSFRS